MTEQEAFKELLPLIRQVTGAKPQEITLGSYLMRDLGAESIDLLDLSFLIEENFGVTIGPEEFEKDARERLSGAEYERDDCLTPESLEELKKALPEVDPALLRAGLKKADVPSVLNVAVFVHLIQRKLAETHKEEVRA
jgi:acyl carrier protein